jgi:hypothetical protein
MFRGQFKFKTTNGASIRYNLGDIVVEQGRAYECNTPTTKSPLQSPNKWTFTGLTEVFNSENPPINPIRNQIWVSGNGTQYIWYKDPNGFQWVEI